MAFNPDARNLIEKAFGKPDYHQQLLEASTSIVDDPEFEKRLEELANFFKGIDTNYALTLMSEWILLKGKYALGDKELNYLMMQAGMEFQEHIQMNTPPITLIICCAALIAGAASQLRVEFGIKE